MITGYSIEGGKISYTPHAREPRPGEPRLVKIEGVSVPIAVPAPLPEEEYPPGRTRAEMEMLKVAKRYEAVEEKARGITYKAIPSLEEIKREQEKTQKHLKEMGIEPKYYGPTLALERPPKLQEEFREYIESGMMGWREEPVKTTAVFATTLAISGISGAGILPRVPVVTPAVKLGLKGLGAAYVVSVPYRVGIAKEKGKALGRIVATELIPGAAGGYLGPEIGGMIKRWRTPTTYEVTRIKGVGAKEFELSQRRMGEEWQYGRIKALGFETEKYTVTGEPPKITDLSQYTDIRLKPTGKEVNLRIFTTPEKFGGATTLKDLFGGEFIISPEYPPTGVIGFEPIGKEPSAIPFEHFFGRATYTQYGIYGIPKTSSEIPMIKGKGGAPWPKELPILDVPLYEEATAVQIKPITSVTKITPPTPPTSPVPSAGIIYSTAITPDLMKKLELYEAGIQERTWMPFPVTKEVGITPAEVTAQTFRTAPVTSIKPGDILKPKMGQIGETITGFRITQVPVTTQITEQVPVQVAMQKAALVQKTTQIPVTVPITKLITPKIVIKIPFIPLVGMRIPGPRKARRIRAPRIAKGFKPPKFKTDIRPLASLLFLTKVEAKLKRRAKHPRGTPRIKKMYLKAMRERPWLMAFPTAEMLAGLKFGEPKKKRKKMSLDIGITKKGKKKKKKKSVRWF